VNPQIPPGPPGRFFLGNLPEFARDILGYLTFCAREYGDVSHFRLGRYDAYLLNHPDLADEVLRTQRENFIKHRFFWRHVTAIFGTGLLTSEGDFWLRQRRLAAPAFHPDRIAAYGGTMVAYTDRLLDGWGDGETRNVHEDMMRVTMEIVSKTLFDADVESDVEELGRAFEMVLREIPVRVHRPIKIPDWIPTPGNLRYRRGVRRLEELVYRILAERRADPGQHPAADQGRAIERQVVVDLHHRVLVQQHALGIAADAGEGGNALPLFRQARRRRGAPGHRAADADVRVTAEALRAAAAEARETGHHVVAGPQRGHLVADRLDDAGALVAEHEPALQREPAVTVHHVQVAVTDPGGHRADEDLPGHRPVDVDGLDGHRRVRGATDRGPDLHRGALSRPAAR